MNFVALEEKGKKIFAKFPKTRRFIKGIYHRISFFLSRNKIKSDGNLVKISPSDEYEYFFGYYDKSPWDITNRYMISMRVKNAHKVPDSIEKAEIVVFDTKNDNKMEIIGVTNCWNTQQGCMAQWLAPDFSEKIIYNDFRDNKYVSIVYNFKKKKEEKVYDMPIYDISKNGEFALTLDFSRLHRLRKGYGYANIEEKTKNEKCPDETCVWKIDLKTGKICSVLKYVDLYNFETRNDMINAEHKVNHIMINPGGNRFMLLHRWFKHGEKYTRLVTLDVNGKNLYNLSDDNFVSHCCWKNDEEILSFLNKKNSGNHYYLMKDKTKDFIVEWPELKTDGHCTYSPNGDYVITDTYPNRKRMAYVYLCQEGEKSIEISKVFAPFKYDNDVRCDLHPRWSHDGTKICIDSVHGGKKELYVIDIGLDKIRKYSNIKASIIIPCYNSAKTIERTLHSIINQLHKNVEILILNDGSKDDLENIINKKIYKTMNIKYIKKENTGVSDTRNVGLKMATGKYIFFVDSDDVISPNFVYRNILECEENNFDCIMSNQSRDVDSVERGKMDKFNHKALHHERDKTLEYFMYNKERIVFASMIYRKKLIDDLNLQFDVKTKYGEDLEFVWKYLVNCNKIGILKESMYGYYNNPTSAVNTVKWTKIDLPTAMERVSKYLHNRNDSFANHFDNYMLPRTYWTTAKTFSIGNKKEYYNKFIINFPVKENMKKLIKFSKSKLLKYSSFLFVVNKYLFYYSIRLIYMLKK